MPTPLTIRIRCALPVVVDGGITKWKIYLDYYGKNGSKLALIAACLNTNQRIVLLDGRESAVVHLMANVLSAEQGTITYRLFRKMVRDGTAETLRG